MRRLDLAALIGQVYGLLTVVGAVRKKAGMELIDNRWRREKRTVIYLDCQCRCGALLTARRDRLQAGYPRSCPACRGRSPTAAKPEEMIGQTFGRLTVQEEAGRDEEKQVLWRVECACGRARLAKTSALRSGQVRSCGQCGHGRGRKGS